MTDLFSLNFNSFSGLEILIFNAIASAILVIIAKNPVISVIFLISLFLNSALYLILNGMSYIGISYILIYLGAIVVLFLFVIMMINVRLSDILEIGSQYTKNVPLALIVSILFIYEFISVLPSILLTMQSSNTLINENINHSLSTPYVLSIKEGISLEMANLNSLITNPDIIKEGEGILINLNNPSLLSELKENPNFINNFISSTPSLNGLENVNLENSTINKESYIIDNINLPKFNETSSRFWPETLIQNFSHITSVAYSLYTYGAFWFLLTGYILLLAMIAPIYLSKRY